jgi:hypothetical protein
MALELRGDIAADRIDLEAMFASVCDQGLDKPRGHALSADFRGNQSVLGRTHSAV